MRQIVTIAPGRAIITSQPAAITAPVVVDSNESTRRSLGAGPVSASAPSFEEQSSSKAGAAPRAVTRLSNDASMGENLRDAR